MVAVEDVEARLRDAFPGAALAVEDTTGDGDHFDVEIRTPAFAGIGLVAQHRMVYAALGDLMPRIHALSLRTASE